MKYCIFLFIIAFGYGYSHAGQTPTQHPESATKMETPHGQEAHLEGLQIPETTLPKTLPRESSSRRANAEDGTVLNREMVSPKSSSDKNHVQSRSSDKNHVQSRSRTKRQRITRKDRQRDRGGWFSGRNKKREEKRAIWKTLLIVGGIMVGLAIVLSLVWIFTLVYGLAILSYLLYSIGGILLTIGLILALVDILS